jgi:hypothetical protein
VLKLQDEKDPEVLRKAALILERENERLRQRVLELQRKVLELQGKGDDPQQLRLRLAELEQQLAVRIRMLFGLKSERSGNQTWQQPDESKVNKGHGHREQPALPILEQKHDLDEAGKVCRSVAASCRSGKLCLRSQKRSMSSRAALYFASTSARSIAANAERASKPPPAQSSSLKALATQSTSRSRSR